MTPEQIRARLDNATEARRRLAHFYPELGEAAWIKQEQREQHALLASAIVVGVVLAVIVAAMIWLAGYLPEVG